MNLIFPIDSESSPTDTPMITNHKMGVVLVRGGYLLM